MKKFLTVFFAVILAVCSFSLFACEKQEEEKTVSVRYYQNAKDVLLSLKVGGENGLTTALLPEPALSNLIKSTPSKQFFSLNLGELYDSKTKSYPQAVLMVKESLLNSYPNIVAYFENTFDSNVNWFKENTAQGVNAINSKLNGIANPSLTAVTIDSAVIDNCNVFWQNAESSKQQVKSFINELIEVNEKSAIKIEDDFFYNGSVSTEKSFDKDTITVACPDGAPALSLAKYIVDEDDFGTNKKVNYQIVNSDSIGGLMGDGTADIIVLPVNAGSKLYKKNIADSYKMLSVVTHGNLYIVSDTEIKVEDLENKKMGVIGQGLVPDLTLQVVLKKHNLKLQIAD